ncbi:integrin alpha, partial [Patescibacteria group bacterium]|nr:integrin alpha [Patescibacteria group bacterium]
DGVSDLAVGAYDDDAGGTSQGALHIHFMNTDGSIDSTVEIDNDTANGPTLNDGDIYGFSVASIGDLDRDGVTDLAVGAPLDDAGGTDRGTVHIHFMNKDGSIDSTVELNDSTANGSSLLNSAVYGVSVASIGDLNGDGTIDLAIGAEGADAGGELGSGRGTLFIHFMHGELETNTFDEDKRCHWETPPEITWIKLIPEIKDDIEGMLVTWVQYDADKVDIAIDDGTGNFPWKLSKTSNDGHEFLPNVTSAQQIKIKPHNHCRKGEYSISVSYNFYPDGWYNIP